MHQNLEILVYRVAEHNTSFFKSRNADGNSLTVHMY